MNEYLSGHSCEISVVLETLYQDTKTDPNAAEKAVLQNIKKNQ